MDSGPTVPVKAGWPTFVWVLVLMLLLGMSPILYDLVSFSG